MIESPIIHTKHSIKVEVEKGKTYMWCSCGQSQAQPFCDGSHQGSSFLPVAYVAQKDGIVGFCGCKMSAAGCICDGSHKALTV